MEAAIRSSLGELLARARSWPTRRPPDRHPSESTSEMLLYRTGDAQRDETRSQEHAPPRSATASPKPQHERGRGKLEHST
jgi:hypothetical protein